MRLTRRTKIISIRLSDEEFGQFESLRAARGIDNLSELARAAMRLLVLQEDGSTKLEIESRMNEIQARMATLDREIERISGLMGLVRLV